MPLILARLAQYALLLPLLGLAVAPLYMPALALPRRALRTLAIGALIAGLAALGATLLAMAGDVETALQPTIVAAVLTSTAAGISGLVRIALLAALIALAGRAPARAIMLLAALATASLAFTGHANGGSGLMAPLRLLADMIHLLAAATWIGALLVLGLMARRGGPSLTKALAKFSGIGSLVVALLVATGLINLAADRHFSWPWPMGVWLILLAAKLCLFTGMLACAAYNRWRLTPALTAGDDPAALKRLKFSLALETTLGAAVLVLVAALGTMDPMH
ncbi:MAG: copper resistance protein CopD [Caulobacteraceae bacterium]|nr:copper resistance protein CopD [Caulobacteraceae bacterium]